MKRGILYTPPMALAAREGRKTQTRRLMATQPPVEDAGMYGGDWWKRWGISCLYGAPGDTLWVREEHYRFGNWEEVPGGKTKGGRQKWRFVPAISDVLFEPPKRHRKGRHHADPGTMAWHKRLGRFMPMALSRTTLEITGIRVERLNDISEADVIAEGTESYDFEKVGRRWKDYEFCPSGAIERWPFTNPVDSYRSLWESINGPGSWDANPWVWVIEFRRVEP